MNEVAIIISALAICLSTVALIVGCIAISICVGLKNSTHTIQWKTLDNPFKDEAEELLNETDPELNGGDPFAENPLRRKKEKEPEDFSFMEDVSEHSNF
jgi:hypothetical protein